MIRFAETPEMDDKDRTILKQLREIERLVIALRECEEALITLQETCDTLKGVLSDD